MSTNLFEEETSIEKLGKSVVIDLLREGVSWEYEECLLEIKKTKKGEWLADTSKVCWWMTEDHDVEGKKWILEAGSNPCGRI